VIARRSFLVGLALTGCSRCDREPPAPATPPRVPPLPEPVATEMPEAGGGVRGQMVVKTWAFDNGLTAVVLVPSWAKPGERFPLLIACHGRGEAHKGPAEGPMGWPRDYALLRAIRRVCEPPLTSTDLEGFVDPKRLGKLNADLTETPFKGLVIVCPYSRDADFNYADEMKPFTEHVIANVLPRARRELPVIDAPAATGIDGVSLGGAFALRIGLAHAKSFGTLGTLQAAVTTAQVEEWTELARAARAANPKLALRLLTSTDDYFKPAIQKTSKAWTQAGVAHEYVEVPGPHDYPFNRGPGAIEMLLWHDRLLARA
jgi:enterochelin esterase-like enzyme